MKDWWWWEFDKIWKKSSLNIIQKILILTVEISTIFSLTRHSDNLTKVKILKSWFYVLRKKASIGATVVLTQKVSKSFIWEVKLLYLNIFVNLTLMYIVCICFFTQKERVLKFEIWTELNILHYNSANAMILAFIMIFFCSCFLKNIKNKWINIVPNQKLFNFFL